MAKEKKVPKPKKERAENYEEKIQVNATFEQLLGFTVEGNPKPKRKEETKKSQ